MTPEEVVATITQLTRIENKINGLVTALASLNLFESESHAEELALLEKIDSEVNTVSPDDAPVSAHVIVFGHRDILTGEEIIMPQNIMNDVNTTLPVEFDNQAGQAVAPPAGGSIVVSLVDGTGAVSTLGTAALAADGVSVDITPALPIGSAMGDANLHYDDTSSNAGTPADISFVFAMTFTNDPNAASAHVNTSAPFPTRPIGP